MAAVAGGAMVGVVADLLLRAAPGVNISLFVAALIAARVVFGRIAGVELPRAAGILYAAALIAAVAIAWRDLPALRNLNTSVCLLMLALAAGADAAITRWGLPRYLRAVGAAVASTASGAFDPRLRQLMWLHVPRFALSPGARAAVRGVLLLLPLLVLFGILLARADAPFEELAAFLLGWDVQTFLVHVAWTALFAWLATGYLRPQFDAEDWDPEAETPAAPPQTLGFIEASVVLAGLNLLFLTFIVLQFPYLFGGRAHIAAATGLTVADYARRGFFELVAVAALVLPILWAFEWSLRRDSASAVRWFRILAGVMVVMMFFVIAGALHRMWLYMQSYGLTELRVFTTAFMLMLGGVFVWFAATVLLGRRERFTTGALAIGFVSLLALNAANPDALIVRTNLARIGEGRDVDVEYLNRRSLDALPALAARDDVSAQEVAHRILDGRVKPDVMPDWRSWNWARYQARRIYGVEL
jgi:hypothetical protein